MNPLQPFFKSAEKFRGPNEKGTYGTEGRFSVMPTPQVYSSADVFAAALKGLGFSIGDLICRVASIHPTKEIRNQLKME